MTEEQRPSRKRKRGGRHHKRKRIAGETTNEPSKVKASSSASSIKSASNSSASFLDKMKAKLSGGYFRMINEKLYTCTGQDALKYFKEDPSLFDVYHAGYQEQMARWPVQPNDVIIKWIKERSPSLVVADFGCGDARLAKSVKNKVFSIDLVSNNPRVIACDMSNTPLESGCVDVAVFCLSLMGTNFPSYVEEANRVLKNGGWLVIAEVKSRLDPSTGGADISKFVEAICEVGFRLVSKDLSNKMFVVLHLEKKEKKKLPKKIAWPELKPCIYKRR